MPNDPDQPPNIYPNALHVSGNPYEVMIELRRLTPKFSEVPGRQPDFDKETLARLRLSPAHAKSLAALLVQNILELERQFGELGIPPDQLEIWDRVVKGAKVEPKK